MKRIHQTIMVAANVMLMSLTFSGCVLIYGNMDTKDKIDIVTVSSDHAHLSRVTVAPNESGLLISGRIYINSNSSASSNQIKRLYDFIANNIYRNRKC